MAQATQTMRLTLVLAVVLGLVVAGAVTFGIAQTLTLAAIISTFVIFYLMIHISAN